MLSLERKKSVLHYLKAHGTAQVVEMAGALGVSESTIRRDLSDLADQGLLTRVHGGASLSEPDLEPSPLARQTLHSTAKRRIGTAAAKLVKDYESILITGGSTTERMLAHLAGRLGLTVITNGINVAMSLAPYPEISVVVLGGVLRHSELSLLGPMAAQTLEAFHVDRAFIGTYGLNPTVGLTGAFADEANTDLSLLTGIGEINVLADSSKFGKLGPARILPASGIRRIITDDHAPLDDVTAFRKLGVDVEFV